MRRSSGRGADQFAGRITISGYTRDAEGGFTPQKATRTRQNGSATERHAARRHQRPGIRRDRRRSKLRTQDNDTRRQGAGIALEKSCFRGVILRDRAEEPRDEDKITPRCIASKKGAHQYHRDSATTSCCSRQGQMKIASRRELKRRFGVELLLKPRVFPIAKRSGSGLRPRRHRNNRWAGQFGD